jgi:hypothetical protein
MRVFCATKIFFLIFDTFKKKKKLTNFMVHPLC